MGSKNDWETMQPAEDTLTKLGIASDARVVAGTSKNSITGIAQ